MSAFLRKSEYESWPAKNRNINILEGLIIRQLNPQEGNGLLPGY